MIHNRVLAAGIIFCLLFTSIVWILVTDQNYIIDFIPGLQNTTSSSKDPGSSMIGDSDIPAASTPASIIPVNHSWISGTGTIVHEDLEGGFFGIVSDDGQRFVPDSIQEDLQINGTRIIFSLREKTDTLSTNMWGIPVSIISIQPGFSQNLSPDAHMIMYERAGGLSGGYESLIIDPDGSGVVRSPAGITSFFLDEADLVNISRTVNTSDFSHLLPDYLPEQPAPDAVIYTITIGNKSVKITDGEAPLQITSLNSQLLQILYKYLETRDTAHMSPK